MDIESGSQTLIPVSEDLTCTPTHSVSTGLFIIDFIVDKTSENSGEDINRGVGVVRDSKLN